MHRRDALKTMGTAGLAAVGLSAGIPEAAASAPVAIIPPVRGDLNRRWWHSQHSQDRQNVLKDALVKKWQQHPVWDSIANNPHCREIAVILENQEVVDQIYGIPPRIELAAQLFGMLAAPMLVNVSAMTQPNALICYQRRRRVAPKDGDWSSVNHEVPPAPEDIITVTECEDVCMTYRLTGNSQELKEDEERAEKMRMDMENGDQRVELRLPKGVLPPKSDFLGRMVAQIDWEIIADCFNNAATVGCCGYKDFPKVYKDALEMYSRKTWGRHPNWVLGNPNTLRKIGWNEWIGGNMTPFLSFHGHQDYPHLMHYGTELMEENLLLFGNREQNYFFCPYLMVTPDSFATREGSRFGTAFGKKLFREGAKGYMRFRLG